MSTVSQKALWLLLICLFHVRTAYAEKSKVIPISSGISIEILDDTVILHKNRSIRFDSQLIDNPPRYVIDLFNLKIPKHSTYTLTEHKKFSAVRTAPHDLYSRIVIDLRAAPLALPPIIEKTNSLEISFSSEEIESRELPVPLIIAAAEVVKAPQAAEEAKTNSDTAEAELRFSVSDLIVTFPYTSRSIRDVTVKSRSSSVLFMTAAAEQIFNAGTPAEKREPAKTLLISPRRFELAPGQERLVRIVVANREEDYEGIFRVNFIPDSEDFKVSSVRPTLPQIKVGLAALVIVSPKSPHAELVATWEGEKLILQNNGNTNIFLDQIRACDGKRCVNLPAKRIYSNARWIIKADNLSSLEFLQKIGEDFENVVIKRKEE